MDNGNLPKRYQAGQRTEMVKTMLNILHKEGRTNS
jgi:hypothetical protein